jgi:ribosomal-protein-alanine N-acetyltransferase
MKIFHKTIPDEIAEQISEIQNEEINTLVESGVLFFVELNEDEKVVCFCSVKPIIDEWEILDVATISEYQNRGFAKKTIGEVLRFAKENGAKKIFLEVRESNFKAIGLYSKFGFEKFAVRKNYYANNGENAICMMLAF